MNIVMQRPYICQCTDECVQAFCI